MKRILSLILAFVLVLGLCACNKKTEEPASTEPVVSTPTDAPEATDPVVDNTEDNNAAMKEAKAAALKEILTNKTYNLNTSAVRASLIHESYMAHIATIQGEDGKMLYTVSGFVNGIMTDYDLYQDAEGHIYFHENLVAATTDNYYLCSDTDGFDITQNLMDLSFFVEAFDKVDFVEYIDNDGNDDHFIVYSNSEAEHLEESDAQIVFDITISKDNTITSIRYYVDDIEWLLMFVSPDQAKLHIPEGTELGEMKVSDAQKIISEAHAAVQIVPTFVAESEEEMHEHDHESEEQGTQIIDESEGYKEVFENNEYVINWDNFTFNFNNWMTVTRTTDANGSFVESISAPINAPTHDVTIKKVGDKYYYGEKDSKGETWKEIDMTGVQGNIKDYGYHAFVQEVFHEYVEQIAGEMIKIELVDKIDGSDVITFDILDPNVKLTVHIAPKTKEITYIQFKAPSATYEISFNQSAVTISDENTSNTILPNDCLQAQIDFLIKIADVAGVTQEDLLSISYNE